MPDPATLPMMFKALRLPAFAQHWEQFAELAEAERWTPPQYLANLCEHELADREARRIERYTHEARLPPGKTLASFDFDHVPGLDRVQVEALANDREWVNRARNLIVFGPSGVGKSHLAGAIAHGLIEHGVRARYTTATKLVQQLQAARQELRLPEALVKLDKYAVLVVDDLGYVKKSEQETSVLFELIAHRYESASLVITANQPFSEWDQVFSDTMMTVAAVDRLVHHATILELKTQSYRKKRAQANTRGRTTDPP